MALIDSTGKAVEVHLPYRARWYQHELEVAMQTKKRAFLLYHRRAGKDIACWNFTILKSITDIPGIYYYILPTYAQGKKVIWNGINETGMRLLDYIPRELVESMNSTEMLIKLRNGSQIQVVGSENFDSLRGTNPRGVVFSEYAMQNPKMYYEIISPILRKNNGWAIFNTTPMGKNHAYDLWNIATASDAWYTKRLTIDDTHLLTRDQIEEERAEGKTEEIILQEYYCSFARGIDGTYYGRAMSKAFDEGRITRVPYDSALEVHTAWDLGYTDPTAMWYFQVTPGGEVHVIDYYECAHEGIEHFVKVVKSKPYIYGSHILPHDAKAHEKAFGMSAAERVRELGIKPIVLENIRIADGVQAVRSMLDRCWWDAKKCAEGIKHLENYRKNYSEALRSYTDKPIHDAHSHAADAFRYAALGIKGTQKKKGAMTAEEAQQAWQRNILNRG